MVVFLISLELREVTISLLIMHCQEKLATEPYVEARFTKFVRKNTISEASMRVRHDVLIAVRALY